MVRATVAHLVKILTTLALRVASVREPHVRTMCGHVWGSDLEKLPLEVLFKILHFLLLHCDIAMIDYMYGIGLFNNRDILSIVIRTIKQRNEHNNPIASRIFRRYRK